MPDDLAGNKRAEEERILIQVISDPTRIQIMKTLSVKQSLCGKDILAHFSITQPTLSHHMNLLCSCGLVDSAKKGKYVYYLLNAEGVKKVIALFEDLIDEKNGTNKPDIHSTPKTAKGPALKKQPMLPNPKSVIPSPDLPEDTVIKKKKSKKKGKAKDGKKGKKKKKKG